MSDIVDHEARADAAKANHRIEGHETLCAERWSQANDRMKALARGMWMIAVLIVSAAIANWLFK